MGPQTRLLCRNLLEGGSGPESRLAPQGCTHHPPSLGYPFPTKLPAHSRAEVFFVCLLVFPSSDHPVSWQSAESLPLWAKNTFDTAHCSPISLTGHRMLPPRPASLLSPLSVPFNSPKAAVTTHFTSVESGGCCLKHYLAGCVTTWPQ